MISGRGLGRVHNYHHKFTNNGGLAAASVWVAAKSLIITRIMVDIAGQRPDHSLRH